MVKPNGTSSGGGHGGDRPPRPPRSKRRWKSRAPGGCQGSRRPVRNPLPDAQPLPVAAVPGPLRRIMEGGSAQRLDIEAPPLPLDLIRALAVCKRKGARREVETAAGHLFDAANLGLRQALRTMQVHVHGAHRHESRELARAQTSQRQTDQLQDIVLREALQHWGLFDGFSHALFFALGVGGLVAVTNAMAGYVTASGLFPAFEDNYLRALGFAAIPVVSAFVLEVFHDHLRSDSARSRFLKSVLAGAGAAVAGWIGAFGYLFDPSAGAGIDLNFLDDAADSRPLTERAAGYVLVTTHILGEILIAASVWIHLRAGVKARRKTEHRASPAYSCASEFTDKRKARADETALRLAALEGFGSALNAQRMAFVAACTAKFDLECERRSMTEARSAIRDIPDLPIIDQ